MENECECICGGYHFSYDKHGKRTCATCGDEKEVLDQVGEYDNENTIGVSKARLPAEDRHSITWSTFEGFNVILFKWCSVLEKFGVPTSIYDSVFTVWFKFLEECNIFSDNGEKMVHHTRDLIYFGIQLKNKKNVNNKLDSVVDKVANRVAGSGNTSFISKQLSETATDIFDDEIELVLEDISDDVNNNCKASINSDGKKSTNWGLSAAGDRSKFYSNLRISKVLALFYLGVRMAGVDVFSCDIIRWCRRGQLPYFNAIQLLEKNQKISTTDINIFKQPLISSEILRCYTGVFAVFISLPCVPMPDYQQVYGRFIEQLRLPEQMNEMCGLLIEVTATEMKVRNLFLPTIELTAACVVILALKIAFGLDDQHEKLLSKWANKINRTEQKPSTINDFFSFEKWQKFIDKTYWWHGEVAPCSEMTENESRTHYDSSLLKSHFVNVGSRNFLGIRHTEWTKEITSCLNNLTDAQPIGANTTDTQMFCPFNPTTGIFSQYLNSSKVNTYPSHLTQAAAELESTTFKDNIFHWILNTNDIERVLSCEVALVSLAFNEVVQKKSEILPSLQEKTNRVLLPDPKLSYWQTEKCRTASDMLAKRMPTNFCWLLKLFARLCETSELIVMRHFHAMEKRYCANAVV